MLNSVVRLMNQIQIQNQVQMQGRYNGVVTTPLVMYHFSPVPLSHIISTEAVPFLNYLICWESKNRSKPVRHQKFLYYDKSINGMTHFGHFGQKWVITHYTFVFWLCAWCSE